MFSFYSSQLWKITATLKLSFKHVFVLLVKYSSHVLLTTVHISLAVLSTVLLCLCLVSISAVELNIIYKYQL